MSFQGGVTVPFDPRSTRTCAQTFFLETEMRAGDFVRTARHEAFSRDSGPDRDLKMGFGSLALHANTSRNSRDGFCVTMVKRDSIASKMEICYDAS